ncbi:MAG: prevent-host-death family protein [Candidatus Solibacter sp.]|nr:prevent-host-death family protein [Candidatus Solibacter sp.]
MKNRVIGATEFKSKCLALLDEIDDHGGTITVTKRGRPVATISPANKRRFKNPAGILAGKGVIIGDIVNFDTTDMWEAVRTDQGH